MKKTILGVVLIFMATAAIACADGSKRKVPKAVKEAFAKKFPHAKHVEWGKESVNEWEAEFKMKDTEYSANFTKNGTWKETEHAIDKSQLPQPVTNKLKTSFSSYAIEESEVSESNKGMVYEFILEKEDRKLEVAIDANGNVTQQQKESKNDNEAGEEDND